VKVPIGTKFGKWVTIGETYSADGRSYTPC